MGYNGISWDIMGYKQQYMMGIGIWGYIYIYIFIYIYEPWSVFHFGKPMLLAYGKACPTLSFSKALLTREL